MFKLLIFFWTILACYSLKASSAPEIPSFPIGREISSLPIAGLSSPGSETLQELVDLKKYKGKMRCDKKIADFFKKAPYKTIDYSISKKNAPNPIEISASAIDFKASQFSGKELIEYTKSCDVLKKDNIHPELYKKYTAFKDSSFILKNNQLIFYSLDRASIKKWILSSIKGKNDIPVLNRNEIKKDLQNDFIEGLKISMDSKALIDENTDLEKYLKQAIIDSILNLDKGIFISEISKKSNNAFLKKQNSSIFIYSHFPEAQKNVKTFDIHIGITNLAVPAEGSESAAQVNAPQSDSAVTPQAGPMRTASPAQVNAPQSDSAVNTQAQAISAAKAKAAQLVDAAKIASGKAQAAQSSSGALVFVNEIESIQTQVQVLKAELNQLDRTIDISDDVQKIADYLAIAQDAQDAQEKAQAISAAKAKAAQLVDAAKIASENAQAAQNSSGALVFVNEIESIQTQMQVLKAELNQLDRTIDISDDVQKIADYLAIAQNAQNAQEKAQAISAAKAKAAQLVDAAKIASENAKKVLDSANKNKDASYIQRIEILKNLVSMEKDMKTIQAEFKKLNPPIDISDSVQKVNRALNQVKRHIKKNINAQAQKSKEMFKNIQNIVKQFENEKDLPLNYSRVRFGIESFNKIFTLVQKQIDFFNLPIDISDSLEKTKKFMSEMEAIEKKFKAKKKN